MLAKGKDEHSIRKIVNRQTGKPRKGVALEVSKKLSTTKSMTKASENLPPGPSNIILSSIPKPVCTGVRSTSRLYDGQTGALLGSARRLRSSGCASEMYLIASRQSDRYGETMGTRLGWSGVSGFKPAMWMRDVADVEHPRRVVTVDVVRAQELVDEAVR